MMKFTDLFIQRPVLSSVVSLLILIVGLRSIASLELREYPAIKSTVISVSTSYPGASSELIQGFITAPLMQVMAEASGIDFLFARSTQGSSGIEAHMVLDYDSNAAVAEIQAKVASQRNVLPAEAEDPVIDVETGDGNALMYLPFFSDDMSLSQVTDYLWRVVQPKFQAVNGVGNARVFGGRDYAMRIWLDPARMAALGVTAADVQQVLVDNNYLSAVGQTKGAYFALDLSATTGIATEEDFRRLVVLEDRNTLVRLEDIADVELGSASYDSAAWFDGRPGIVIAIETAPGSNPLAVARRVHEKMLEIQSQLPSGMHGEVAYDASRYIEDSINEVFVTLAEAILIVLAVIFLSLGSARAAIVPAVAVPLSLVGAATIMLALGFSINLLTLLALVLAIGLVVDDAIIVVENVHRHIDAGATRKDAAIAGAREIGMPIIAMTTTLVAVYAPIGFMQGLVGTLFTEFAFTLAGAVLISGVVALTLSPMLSAKVLSRHGEPGPFERAVEGFFARLAASYQRVLNKSLDTVPVTLIFAAVVTVSIYFLFVATPGELAPDEDKSFLGIVGRAPQTATLEYNEAYTRKMIEAFDAVPEFSHSWIFMGSGDVSTIFGGFELVSAHERERSQAAVQPEVQVALDGIAGLQLVSFPWASLPGTGGGLPVQFVVLSDSNFAHIDEVVDDLMDAAMTSGNFGFLQKTVEFARPRKTLIIDRDRAADLNISMADIGKNLSAMLGENYVNRFNLEGRSYKVIPQVARNFRLDSGMLDDYYISSGSGDLVPLSMLARFEESVEPSQRTQFQQLNSVMVQGMMAPGIELGEALAYLESYAETNFPRGFSWDYNGQSRQFKQQGSALIVTFFMSLLVIYLVLAAQFESWRDPLIILVSVPMSIAGALVFMTLGFATVNIYTQVGLITLIGLISKNGILIVEFANQLQLREGLGRREAVEKAAAIRLRPILMTTVAMILAMVPLLLASGPGAVSRFQIGLVIAAGLGIGTLFTLFVVPAVYLVFTAPQKSLPRLSSESLFPTEERST